MSTEITGEVMRAKSSRHTAVKTAEGWTVSWLPGRVVDHNQAVTAMVLADHIAGGIDAGDRRWPFVEGWAAELGLSATEVVEQVSHHSAALAAAAPVNSAGCNCPEADGAIRHLRSTCTDQVAHRLGWFADTDDSGPDTGIKIETAAGTGVLTGGPVPRVNPTETVGKTAGPAALPDRLTWQKKIAWSELPTAARCLGLVMALYTDEHATTAIYLTHKDLCRLTGLSPAVLRRYLDMLEQEGWLARFGRGHPAARWLSLPGELPITARPGLAEATT